MVENEPLAYNTHIVIATVIVVIEGLVGSVCVDAPLSFAPSPIFIYTDLHIQVIF